jgi:hypothetical protein
LRKTVLLDPERKEKKKKGSTFSAKMWSNNNSDYL